MACFGAHKTKVPPNPRAFCIGRQLFSPCPFLSSTFAQLAGGSRTPSFHSAMRHWKTFRFASQPPVNLWLFAVLPCSTGSVQGCFTNSVTFMKTVINLKRDMRTEKIWDKDNKSFLRAFFHDNIEKVNPIEYYTNFMIFKSIIMERDLLDSTDPILSKTVPDSFLRKRAEERSSELIDLLRSDKVDENVLKIFETFRKKDQVNLWKNQSINPDQLFDLTFKSYEKYGYLYSNYRFEILDSGSQSKILPKAFHLDDNGEIQKIGETTISDGELKNVLLHRKVIVAHIFEKDDCWHSLFLTYNSLKGEENWNDGQAHFHYISSAFNISKDEFVESMKSGKYLSTKVHITLKDYGHQVEEE
jgi:hypothetical protein